LYAQATGLQPATEYESRIKEGEVMTNLSVRFTTEAALQLPNSSFENWSGSTPLLIFGEGQSMFWDSGNHGSATMSKNVTEPDASVKMSGERSIRLKSQFVGIGGFIGKFAAGNLFAGKYLKTDGTDGVLGWGRPFTSRPTALRGYIKYRPGVVDYSETDLISKNDTDQGIVYVAIGDWAPQDFEGEQWPVVVKTKSKELFDPSEDNKGTIAYGEYVLNSDTDGEEMIEFIIPLDYRDTRKPISLVLVASASRYGDYFSGSSNSTMWLDDLEFIYE
ncbi:MAG: PCMD domain-containing protein, partial [Bacteroidales bacterium]